MELTQVNRQLAGKKKLVIVVVEVVLIKHRGHFSDLPGCK